MRRTLLLLCAACQGTVRPARPGPEARPDLTVPAGRLQIACDTDGDGEEEPQALPGAVACLDRDGDGRYGVLVVGEGAALHLFEEGVDVAADAGLVATRGARAVVVAPFFAAASDVFVATVGGPNLFFRARGDGRFAELASVGVADEDQNAAVAAAVDIEPDGRLDLAVGNDGGRHRMFVRRGDGFLDVAFPVWAETSRPTALVVADLDGDGHDELFLGQRGAPPRLFTLADGIPQPVAAALLPHGPRHAAALDLDGDNRLELVLDGHVYGYRSAPPAVRVQPLTRAGAPARGALVVALVRGSRWAHVVGGVEPVVHLGGAPSAVEITWPDGAHRRIESPSPGLLRVEHP